MDTTTTRPTRPSRPTSVADYHRLAALGRERGLRLIETSPNHWYCSSHSSPLALHVVTGWTCDCAGFAHHGRCSHHSLLLDHLGWLPPREPEPPAVVTCPGCYGAGLIYVAECERHSFPFPPCDHCAGTGQVAEALVAA